MLLETMMSSESERSDAEGFAPAAAAAFPKSLAIVVALSSPNE